MKNGTQNNVSLFHKQMVFSCTVAQRPVCIYPLLWGAGPVTAPVSPSGEQLEPVQPG